MTTLDHFPAAHSARDLSLLPALLTAVLLLVLMGGTALMAPAQPDVALDWHGNAATTAR
ncbi:hypothetical protein ACOXXX_02095 [Thalassococcus sp. BH17M4-6]|uniref:hypothetical protein n=1 Tax=Thalassococcus sp. BH17M4-6 TaxID=3413148 RepID=UPI003BD0A468